MIRTAGLGLALCITATACGAPVPSATPSAAPSGSVSPPSESPVPTSNAIVAAFLALTQTPRRTMHMELTGSVESRAGDSDIRAGFDFSGEDYAGIQTLKAPATGNVPAIESKFEIAFVDGIAYTRFQMQGTTSEQWVRQDGLAGNLDPLRGLAADDIDYVGLETIDGVGLHHLRLNDMKALKSTLIAGAGAGPESQDPQLVASESSLHIYLDGTGQPVSGALVIVKRTDTGDLAERVTAQLQFSNWGAEIQILKPPL